MACRAATKSSIPQSLVRVIAPEMCGVSRQVGGRCRADRTTECAKGCADTAYDGVSSTLQRTV
jgi:hypothetical protein